MQLYQPLSVFVVERRCCAPFQPHTQSLASSVSLSPKLLKSRAEVAVVAAAAFLWCPPVDHFSMLFLLLLHFSLSVDICGRVTAPLSDKVTSKDN